MQKVIKAVYKRYTWKQYIRSVKNHLAKVYTDKKRLDSVLAYADHFNDYFRNGVVPTPIAKYVKAYEHTDFDARLIQNRMNYTRPANLGDLALPEIEDHFNEPITDSGPAPEFTINIADANTIRTSTNVFRIYRERTTND